MKKLSPAIFLIFFVVGGCADTTSTGPVFPVKPEPSILAEPPPGEEPNTMEDMR